MIPSNKTMLPFGHASRAQLLAEVREKRSERFNQSAAAMSNRESRISIPQGIRVPSLLEAPINLSTINLATRLDLSREEEQLAILRQMHRDYVTRATKRCQRLTAENAVLASLTSSVEAVHEILYNPINYMEPILPDRYLTPEGLHGIYGYLFILQKELPEPFKGHGPSEVRNLVTRTKNYIKGVIQHIDKLERKNSRLRAFQAQTIPLLTSSEDRPNEAIGAQQAAGDYVQAHSDTGNTADDEDEL